MLPWVIALGPLLPVLVTQIEKLFGKGQGATKLNTVLGAVTPILTNLVNAQTLGGPMPPTADIVAEISKTAAQLFPTGTTYDAGKDPLAKPVPASPLAPVSAPVSEPTSGLPSDQKLMLIKAVLAL